MLVVLVQVTVIPLPANVAVVQPYRLVAAVVQEVEVAQVAAVAQAVEAVQEAAVVQEVEVDLAVAVEAVQEVAVVQEVEADLVVAPRIDVSIMDNRHVI
ncbi:hypothetical protein ATK78_2960 [Pedobacter metabolipauper]|uniref:Uncharacterized protein n=1 Tax=Pedobacter metabolipauper TaxID=425513 RepID=A0A4R6SU02_9SPHI|nr:hypothetical protein ATK78_2960 [Pedobacter metabolipauper]